MYSTAVILMVVCLTQNVASFVVPFPSAAAARNGLLQPLNHCSLFVPTSRLRQSLHMMSKVNSEDPFVILNVNPTADVREIKRAYKRAALKYHPDVVCNSGSTKEERRQANDHFAKINWAYEQLSGKQSTASTSTTQPPPPPHRRKAASTSYSTNTSTDWRDYIPNYNKEEEQYDAGGDSFGAILSDLLGAAASTAAGSGGIFRDFVEFLEQNVDGYATTKNNDNADLDALLKYASKQEVAMEMEDTELVVTSLESKQRNVNDELLTKTADLQFAQRFSERVELEERIAELQARKRVVDGYLKTARKRLLSLQSRYKELVVGGRVSDSPPPPRGEYTRSSYEPFTRGGTSAYSSSSSSSTSSSTGASSRRASTTTTSSSTSETENAWKTQGFGSSGRGRGSSSRRGRSRPSSGTERAREEPARDRPSSSTWNTDESSPRQERATPPQPPPPRTNTPARTTVSSTDDWKAPVPPHRRSKSEPSQAQKDRKRLRELQVEDEFAKLKKELGL